MRVQNNELHFWFPALRKSTRQFFAELLQWLLQAIMVKKISELVEGDHHENLRIRVIRLRQINIDKESSYYDTICPPQFNLAIICT
ncbi:hypothetical protein TB2_022164 [Malus domestica]